MTLRTRDRRRSWSTALSGLLVATALTALPGTGGGTALAAPGVDASRPVAHDRPVSSVPARWTPQIKDGRVLAIAQVGPSMVVGGTFSSVSPSGGSPILARQRIVAFDATNGAITSGFNPSINGDVNALAPGPTAGTVYVAGSFTSVNGVTTRLALLDTTTGARVTSFSAAPINGVVKDLVRHGDRLYVAGTFTNVGGSMHRGLATLNARTGARDAFMGVDVTENHNWTTGSTGAKAAVGVTAIAVSPDGRSLAAVGNFRKADGLERDQALLVDLSGASARVAPDWRTRRYEPACAAGAFDSYMRDIDFSPDGAYFTIATTGGPHPGTLCDTATRWDLATRGDDVQPAWIDDTGGDTLLSVAATGAAVYVGGHQRWQNNAGGRDRPAPGAVPRPGLGGIDPRSGVPLTWNPGRNPRGVGAFALVPTEAGLWVGSDTNHIGNKQYWRPRLAFFPLQGGEAYGPGATGRLPADVYLGGPGGTANTLVRRYFDGSRAQAPQSAPGGGISWSSVRGAVVIDGTLHYGTADGAFHRRAFDGTTYGPDSLVDPYESDPVWSDVQTGSGQTYRGRKPTFYAELPTVTGMAYASGRLYYTVAGQLYSRRFSPDSAIVSPERVTVPGVTGAAGLFFSGGDLWFSSAVTGSLSRVAWSNGRPQGSPVVVSGPAIDGVDWRSRALFLLPGSSQPPPTNQPPTAAFAPPSCTAATCTVDASSSSDADGTIQGYSWSFGDGGTGEGQRTSHTYTRSGTYQIVLTVTDDKGATASASRTVTVTVPTTGTLSFVAAAEGRAQNATSVTVPVPGGTAAGDTLLLFVTVNNNVAGTIGAPTGAGGGWVRETTRRSWSMQTVLFSRVVGAGGAGGTVTVPLGNQAKVDAQLAVYRGAAAADPTRTVAARANGSTAQHLSPTATAQAGDLAVTYWADKSSSTTLWTPPGEVTARGDQYGTGSGRVSSLLTDSGAPVGGGTYGGFVARTNAPSARGTSLLVVLAPGT